MVLKLRHVSKHLEGLSKYRFKGHTIRVSDSIDLELG